MIKEQFEQLAEEGYDMNILYLLSLSNKELQGFVNSKVKSWVGACIRKQLLTEDYKLTLTGKELLDRYTSEEEIDSKLPDKDKIEEAFEEWWACYPSSDMFTYKGMVFRGSQAKKISKNKGQNNCWDNWRKLVNEGKYSMEDIIRATKFHIQTAKDISYAKKENQLTFIPNSERYLRIEAFEPYISLSKKQKEIVNGDYSTEG